MLLGRRPSLLALEAIALRLEATAIRAEAIAIRLLRRGDQRVRPPLCGLLGPLWVE